MFEGRRPPSASLESLFEALGLVSTMKYPAPGPLPGMVYVHRDPEGQCTKTDCDDPWHRHLEIQLPQLETYRRNRGRPRKKIPLTNPHYVAPVYLTEEQGRQIKTMLDQGRSRLEIMREFGISETTVRNIGNGIWSPRRR